MFNVSSLQLHTWLAEFMWPFCRILALLSTAPLFSARGIPAHVKVLTAFVVTILVAPLLPAMPNVSPASAYGLLIVAQQILIGVAMGLAIRLLFMAFEMAGHIIGLQMGLGFATFFDPQNGTQVPLVGQFLTIMAMLLFLSLNGHLLVINALVSSFETIPIGANMASWSLRALVLSAANMFAWGIQLAMPVVGALMLVNAALGVLTRASPQLNIFAVGFPLTMGVGFVILGISIPYFLPLFDGMLNQSIALMLKIARPLP
ncbi:MAG: flagellar biosynthetic protein FliR [Methylophilales bacterium]|nr:flagellar biosynthetic protein FliR [Methylophilales bacterium]